MGSGSCLWHAGCAACGHDLSHVHRVRSALLKGSKILRIEAGSVDEFVKALRTAGPLIAFGQDKLYGWRFFEDVLHDREVVDLSILGGKNPCLGSGQTGKMIDLDLGVSWDQQNHNSPDFLKGEKREDEFVPVGQLNHDPVPSFDAEGHEANSQAVHLVTKLGVDVMSHIINEAHFVRVEIRRLVEYAPPRHSEPPSASIILLHLPFVIRRESFKHRHSSS